MARVSSFVGRAVPSREKKERENARVNAHNPCAPWRENKLLLCLRPGNARERLGKTFGTPSIAPFSERSGPAPHRVRTRVYNE